MTMTADQKLLSKFYETIGNKINGQLIDIIDGPVVCNFIVKPTDKSNMTTITKAAHDNEYVVTCSAQRITVQIPKESRQMIFLEKLLKSKEFQNTDAVLPMVMGVDTFGDIIINDLQKMPHLLVTGRTGSGKSIFLNCLLKSLESALSPSECKFVIIDPMGVDHNHWDGNKHLLRPVVRLDAYEAVQALQDIVQLVDDRYQKLADNKVKNIFEYNQTATKKDMPYIVVVVDEMADLMCVGKRKTEFCVQAIANKARAVGIHLVLATQRPDNNTLTAVIRANMPTRVAFQARSSKDSMLMLGERGAENLMPCGDMLFSDAGRYPIRIHSPYIDLFSRKC